MDESTWYSKQRSQLEESLWKVKQRSRVLQNYRSEIQKIWQDDAAPEINQRFLNPHEEDSEHSLEALTQQLSYLSESDKNFQKAGQILIESNALSGEIEQLIDFSRQEISRGYSEYSNFQDKNSAALSELPLILQCINQANSCCSD